MADVNQYRLPDPGEGLTEAEIVEWKVKVGDTVKVNDIVVEVETAKSLVELPSPYAGTVLELLAAVGDTVEVGTPIISIGDPSAAPAAAPAAPAESGTDEVATPAADEAVEPGMVGSPAPAAQKNETLVGYGPRESSGRRRPRKGSAVPSGGAAAQAGVAASFQRPHPEQEQSLRPVAPVENLPEEPAPVPHGADGAGGAAGATAVRPLAKPPVRKLAKDLGVDLTQVVGSGTGGVITRADVESFTGAQAAPSATGVVAAARTPVERETRIPIKGVRKMTAQAMVGSAFTAPHVTEFVTVDVTATMDLVQRLKADREFRDVKVSPLLVVAKALCLAVQRNPEINATWDEAAAEIVVKHYVNLGIAAATPRGLIVPNIKDADRMSMRELAEAMGQLVATAREGRTQPAEMSGGTITITNVGVFGVDTGTPILNPGESAILAFGAVRKMPWVVDDQVVPRWVTQLALSFDHRLVDGELGSKFLADVAALLEDPGRALVWA